MTRKDREKLVRRNNILKSAVKIFAQKGYEKTTLDEIAKKAEYSKGTIYNCFKSKEDLFINLIQHGLNQLENRVRNILNDNMKCREQVRNIAIETLKYCN